MRNNILFLAIVAMIVIGCQRDEKLAELRFCADISSQQPCIGEDTIFIRGTDVWAQLLLKPGFTDTAVIGKFYGYQNGERVFIEQIVHTIVKGETIVMEALFLNICGSFEVEFYDTRGNLLDRKGFQLI
jgi:hypothetical protein